MKMLPLVLLVLSVPLAAQEFVDTHPEVGVRHLESASGDSVEASVAGELLDWVTRRSGSGATEIFLLAAPEGAPGDLRSLYRLDLATEALELLDRGIAKEVDRLISLDLDSDGTDEVILGQPGSLSRVRWDSADTYRGLAQIYRSPGIDLAGRIEARGGESATTKLLVASAGVLRRFGTIGPANGPAAGSPETPPWGQVSRQDLPRQAERSGHGLRLTSPPVELLRLEDRSLIAIGPEVAARNRLRVELRSLDGEQIEEMWCRLPGQEAVQSSRFAVLDGRPMLLVTTNSADKVAIFEKQTLHLFALYGDRTRAGNTPWLTTQTTSRRWQKVDPQVVDIDADGDEDLLVLQVDGLGSGKLVARAFLNNGRREFEPKPRKTTFAIPPQGWFFGADLTADGRPDLVILSDGTLTVHALLPPAKKALFEKAARWTFAGGDIPRSSVVSLELGDDGVAVTHERPSSIGRPRVEDIDGDGEVELLLGENPRWGFGRLRVHFLARRSD